MNRSLPFWLLTLAGYWLTFQPLIAQTITVSGDCITNPIVLTKNAAGEAATGRVYYDGVGTINGTPGVTISVAWVSTPYNLWFVRFSGAAYYYYPNPTPLPPNNHYGNWIKITDGNKLTYCPNGTTVSITGDGTQQDPLPVSLANFYSQTHAHGIELKWTTTEERLNAGFEMMRSADAQAWETIGYIDGKGTTKTLQSYSLDDRQPLSGLNYYRLTQVDQDGTATYSRIIAVWNESSQKLISYPSPTHDNLMIKLPNGQRIQHIQIRTTMGKILHSSATSQSQLGVGDLPAGQYLLEVTTNTGLQMIESFVKR